MMTAANVAITLLATTVITIIAITTDVVKIPPTYSFLLYKHLRMLILCLYFLFLSFSLHFYRFFLIYKYILYSYAFRYVYLSVILCVRLTIPSSLYSNWFLFVTTRAFNSR